MNVKQSVCSALSVIPVCLSAADFNDFDKDREQIIRNIHDVLYDSQAQAPMENFQADGTWSDVNYDDHSRGSNWTPQKHLSRMKTMASARPDLAVKALEGWLKKNPTSPNWWWECIGIPRNIGMTVFLIRPENVPADLLKRLEPVFRKTYGHVADPNRKFTGQNLIWVEEIRIYTGLLFHEPELVREGHSVILSELRIAPEGKEGLQDDFSYHQHGAQNQVGNYGMSFLDCQIQWAHCFKGTRLACSEKQIRLLDRYFSDCVRWTLSDGIMDYNFCGRQMWDKAPAGKYRSCMNLCQRLMPLLPEERQQEYRETLKDPDSLTGAVAFPRSACLIYRSPNGWLFSLKMSSPKLMGAETINSENTQGRYQGDGAVFFGRMSRYNNYPALYNQRMLPGTTEVQNKVSLNTENRVHNTNGAYAVLADFPVAVAAFRLDAADVQADKVWFCTPSGVTCAGSGICSNEDSPVVTTVDQYRLDSEKDFPLEVIGEGIQRTVEKRTGNWKDSFREFPSQIVTGEVVTLSIDHGIKPDHAGYWYSMRKKGINAENEIKLQTSSKRIHALSSGKWILSAAFEKGTITLPDGKQLEAVPGIAVWNENGDLLRRSDFRIR